MTKELQDELFGIVKGLNWFEHCYYVECSDGWYPLIKDLVTCIQALSEDHPESAEAFRVYQIKEKFGGLRFYWGFENCEDDSNMGGAVRVLVDWSEGRSFSTCEECGSNGRERSLNGWIATRCEEHR